MRYWNLTWAIPATAGIGVIWAVSAVANYQFGLSQGTDEPTHLLGLVVTTAQINGFASLAVDVLKAVLPAVAVVAWVQSRYLVAAAVTGMFALCVLWSAQSSIGYVVTNHARATDGRGQAADQWKALKTELERSEQERGLVPVHRPSAVIQAEISAMRADSRFKASEHCSADVPGTREFCRNFRGLSAEQAAADSADALDVTLADLRRQLDTRRRVTDADPLATAAGGLLGVGSATFMMGRSLSFSVLLEILSAVGLSLIWGVYFAVPVRNTNEAPSAVRTAPAIALEVVPPPPAPTLTAIAAPMPAPSGETNEPALAAPVKNAAPVARLAVVGGSESDSTADTDRLTVIAWLGACTDQADTTALATAAECAESLSAYCAAHDRAAVDAARLTQIMTEILKPGKVGNRLPRDRNGRIWPGLRIKTPARVKMRA